MREGGAPDIPLGLKILTDMRNFARFGRLKRIALTVGISCVQYCFLLSELSISRIPNVYALMRVQVCVFSFLSLSRYFRIVTCNVWKISWYVCMPREVFLLKKKNCIEFFGVIVTGNRSNFEC